VTKRFVRSHELRVALPPERAMHLFTPVGERLWVDGWDPVFPAGEQGDGSTPGTVFLTEQAELPTFWTVLDRGPDHVRYSRVTPGHTAGTVSVALRPEGGRTVAAVEYDLTPLTAAGEEYARHLADDYGSYIAVWESMIADALATGRIPGGST
jgi:hypothetical protein